jgi:hypothetical protein
VRNISNKIGKFHVSKLIYTPIKEKLKFTLKVKKSNRARMYTSGRIISSCGPDPLHCNKINNKEKRQ